MPSLLCVQAFHLHIIYHPTSLQEEYGPYPKRPSCLRWVKWVHAIGGRVRGQGQSGAQAASGGRVKAGSKNYEEEFRLDNIVPLQLVDPANDELMDFLFDIFRQDPRVQHWYLHCVVFPEVMRFQNRKLSNNGQVTGRTIFFC